MKKVKWEKFNRITIEKMGDKLFLTVGIVRPRNASSSRHTLADFERGKKVSMANYTLAKERRFFSLDEVVEILEIMFNVKLSSKDRVEWKDGDILNTVDKDGVVHTFELKELSKLSSKGSE